MNTQQLQLVTFEQAEKLKTFGFKWGCEYCYSVENAFLKKYGLCSDTFNQNKNYVSAPTISLALKWIRDVKGIFSCVYFDLTSFRKGFYGSLFKFDEKTSIQRTETISTYEAAESALMDKLLTILENGNGNN